MAQVISTNTFGCAKWIVSADATQGTHTTIAGALTSAVAGDTIFIRNGTYTESVTLKAGVNLTAYGCDSSLNGTGVVIINGTCTLTTAGTVTISGIQLQTNSAALLAVTGSAGSVVNLFNCYLNILNNTGITYSSSSASSGINIEYCQGNIGTTGIAAFAHSSAGKLSINYTFITNTGATTTASTASAGVLAISYSQFLAPITTSSTNLISTNYCNLNTSTLNTTVLTVGGSGGNVSAYDYYSTGSASCISISSTLLLSGATLVSSNTNAITGAGSLTYSGLIFENSNKAINVTTQAGGTMAGGVFQAPSAGFLGEQIRSYQSSGQALMTTQAKTVTSIVLTAGIWDISGVVFFSAGSGTVSTFQQGSISATNNALGGNYGDDTVAFVAAGGIVNLETTQVIPALRVTLTAGATYYLTASGTFSTNTLSASGRISATRVG